MLRTLRLTASLLAGLAMPALAQTPSTTPAPGRAAPPPVTAPARPSVVPPAAPTATTPAAPTAATPAPAPAPTTPAPTAATPAPRTTAAAPATMGRRIDINGATEAELAALPGIGPVTAKNIVAGRPWDDMADLVKKKAMPQATLDRNKDRFALANINTSSVADMSKTLPGIGDVRARKIADGRPYAKPEDLVGKKVLTEAQFDKIKDLVTY